MQKRTQRKLIKLQKQKSGPGKEEAQKKKEKEAPFFSFLFFSFPSPSLLSTKGHYYSLYQEEDKRRKKNRESDGKVDQPSLLIFKRNLKEITLH